MTEEMKNFLINAWEQGTRDEILIDSKEIVQEQAKVILDYSGIPEGSRLAFTVHGFIMGLNEGIEIASTISRLAHEKK